MFTATCRWCKVVLVTLSSCEHLHLGHDGQVYLLQGSHTDERDPYTEVTIVPDEEPADEGTSAETE